MNLVCDIILLHYKTTRKTGAQNVVKERKQYQEKWLQHLQRTDTNRIPKQALQYQPKRRMEHRTTEEEMEGPTLS
jgi:hypothetical protein